MRRIVAFVRFWITGFGWSLAPGHHDNGLDQFDRRRFRIYLPLYLSGRRLGFAMEQLPAWDIELWELNPKLKMLSKAARWEKVVQTNSLNGLHLNKGNSPC